MKKYKLIKEYPGSPALGTIALPYTDSRDRVVHYIVEHTRKDCDYLALPKKHIEDNPDYWEEVKDNYYIIYLRNMAFCNAWEPIRTDTECCNTDHKKLFKTKEDAEHFILYNKPCLSIHDILERYGYSREFGKNWITFRGGEESLNELAKSKL